MRIAKDSTDLEVNPDNISRLKKRKLKKSSPLQTKTNQLLKRLILLGEQNDYHSAEYHSIQTLYLDELKKHKQMPLYDPDKARKTLAVILKKFSERNTRINTGSADTNLAGIEQSDEHQGDTEQTDTPPEKPEKDVLKENN